VLSSLPDNSSGPLIQPHVLQCSASHRKPPLYHILLGSSCTSCHHSPSLRKTGVLTGLDAARKSASSVVMSFLKINTLKLFPSSTIMIILIFELPAVEHFLNWILNSLNISNKHEWQFHLTGCIILRDALWRLLHETKTFFPSQTKDLTLAFALLCWRWAPVSVAGYGYLSARAKPPLGCLSS